MSEVEASQVPYLEIVVVAQFLLLCVWELYVAKR